MSTSRGILRDYQGVPLVSLGSFLRHQLILYAELIVICEGLEFTIQLSYSMLEVEFDSAMVVSWIVFSGYFHCDYAHFLCKVHVLTSSFTILVRHILCETTSVTDFLANWVCTHRVR